MPPVRTFVITGAGGHLGRAVASWCARPETNLILLDRDVGRLRDCEAALGASGASITAIDVDLADPDAGSGAIRSLPASLWSFPFSLVVAHGVPGRSGSVAPRLGALRHDDWRATIEANLSSVAFLIQAFLPRMKAAQGGRIVLVSSTAGLAGSPTAALSYAVSKAGVAALPRLLAPELGPSGILINAVAPGKFSNADWPDDPEQVAQYAATVPLGRLASAEEVAALIGFLASEANTYLTGQTILQDGGRLSGFPPGGRR